MVNRKQLFFFGGKFYLVFGGKWLGLPIYTGEHVW